MSSTPDMPSIAEWCTLAMIATRSCSRPSTYHSSHSGRERSSGRPAISAVSAASSRGPPGDGQRGAAHVVVEVEVGILDPQRVVQVERHRHQAAPERRQQVHPLAQQVAHPVDVERDRAPSTGRGSPCSARACAPWASRSRGRRRRGRKVACTSRSLPSSAGQNEGVDAAGWFLVCSRSSGSASRSTRSGPSRRPVFLVGFGFFSAWLTTELALVPPRCGRSSATAAFVAAGALDSWPGWLGLALTLASWVGPGVDASRVAAAHRRGDATRRSRDALARRLRRPGEPRADASSWARVLLPIPPASAACSGPQPRLRRRRQPPAPSRHLPAPSARRRTGHRRAGAAADPRRRRGSSATKDQQGLPLMYHARAAAAGSASRSTTGSPPRPRGPTISSTASARWRGCERAHRRVRRRPRLRRRHRRLGRRSPHRDDRPHRERPAVPARLRGRPTRRCARWCRSTASTTSPTATASAAAATRCAARSNVTS